MWHPMRQPGIPVMHAVMRSAKRQCNITARMTVVLWQELLTNEDDGGRLLRGPGRIESLTRAGPTPTNISMKSDPAMDRKGTLASPAVALAAQHSSLGQL